MCLRYEAGQVVALAVLDPRALQHQLRGGLDKLFGGTDRESGVVVKVALDPIEVVADRTGVIQCGKRLVGHLGP